MNNLKKRKWLYIMIIVQSMIMMCCGLPYCEKTQFTKDELEWTTPYKEGDVFVMTNENLSLQDTLIIHDIRINNPRNTFLFDLEGCNWMEGDNKNNAIAVFLFTIIHQSAEYDCIFTLVKDFSNQPADIFVDILGNYMFDYNPESINKAKKIKIGDKNIYNEALLIAKDRYRDGQYQKVLPLDYIIWDKKKGLVAYKLTEDRAPYILNN